MMRICTPTGNSSDFWGSKKPLQWRRFIGMLLLFQLLYLSVSAQSSRVTGTVKDNRGETLIGVTVKVKGVAQGTTTDVQGNYAINVADKNAVLVFSYIGFLNKEVAVNGNTVVNVTLLEDTKSLEEVVVVGYGSQRKASVVGSISSVDVKDIIKAPVSNIANALAGRATGITTTQRGGEPGRDVAEIYIRGVSTFASAENAQPLVLVDGVERSLATIDPNTVESFNVLKDASATAVFGIRGANGVIIITTKSGAVGKPQFNFSSNFALQNPINMPKLLNAYDYATLRNEAEVNDGGTPVFSATDLEKFQNGSDPYFYPDIDWMDYLIKDYAPQQQYNFNASGGTQSTKYFVSLGHFNQDGAYKLGNFFDDFSANPKFKRYNVRANFDFNINRKLSLFVKAGTDLTNSNYAVNSTSSIIGTILSANPMMSPVVYDGKIIRNITGSSAPQVSSTPLYELLSNGFNTNFSSTLTTNLGAKYDLDAVAPGLVLRGQVAYDSYYMQTARRGKQIPMYDINRNPNDPTSPIPALSINQYEGPVGLNEERFDRNRKIYGEAALEYKRTFSANHNVTGLLLGTGERSYLIVSATPEAYQFLPYNYLGLAGRATYNYKAKYFVEANIGYNGSENFARDRQFGFFPAGSLGYVITEEPFFPKSKVLSYLKLRGSYGIVGNDRAFNGGARQRFLFLPQTFGIVTANGSNNNVFHTGPNHTIRNGYREQALGNSGVTWETGAKSNIGADLKMFSDKLSIAVDVFRETRDEILSNLTIPYTFGPAGLISRYNIGQVVNKGYEFELNFNDDLSKDFNYFFKGTYSFARNKIIYQDEPPQPFPGLAATGNRVGQFKGLIADGFYNTIEEINDPARPKSAWEGGGLMPGDVKYVDITGDGLIDDNDRVNIGNPNIPEIIFGGSLGFNWKKFELSAFFQGAANVSTYLVAEAAWPFVGRFKTGFETAKERWTPERYANGETISAPRLSANPGENLHNYRPSTLWQRDASYVRLRNLEIAYNFNPKLISKIGIRNIRVFTNGQNLYTWTKLKNFDPEISNRSNGAVYPIVRVFNFGTNIQF
jgi:TonB-linked SusC/RagA family outer membrane protein